MRKPRHIFFDLDHTLWDYDANAEETIRELLDHFRPDFGRSISFEEFYAIYSIHNQNLWTIYRQNQIDNLTLRYQRWRMTFEDLGYAEAEWMQEMSTRFLDLCPRKPTLLPNAIEVLEVLCRHFPMHIITNGFAEIQDLKLDHSGLRKYFDVIVTPDVSGFKKPHPQIFKDALAAADCLPADALYIGDSHAEDMVGGSAIGMDVIFFNPKGKANPGGFQEIQDLQELIPMLGL